MHGLRLVPPPATPGDRRPWRRAADRCMVFLLRRCAREWLPRNAPTERRHRAPAASREPPRRPHGHPLTDLRATSTKSKYADGASRDAHCPDIRAALAAREDPVRPRRVCDPVLRRRRRTGVPPRPSPTLKAGLVRRDLSRRVATGLSTLGPVSTQTRVALDGQM